MTCNIRNISFNMHNQELMIGSRSVLLAPVAVAQLQAIPALYGLIADMKQGASWDTIRSSSGLIGWVTWSRAHKSSVGATRKVSPNWSQETMTSHSSNCFSIVRGQGRTIGVTPLGSFIRREGRGLMSEQRSTIEPKRSSYRSYLHYR